MTNEDKNQLEEIIEEICGVTTDYEELANEVADGDRPELTEALVALYEEDMPYGAITGDTMTREEWIADQIAELD